MGKSLQDLGLANETLPGSDVSFDDMPEFGGFTPPPQPGAYRFKLPTNLNTIWDTIPAEKTRDMGPRVKAQFDQDAPLTIVASPGNTLNGDPYQTTITNVPRKRGKDQVLVSDMDLLLRALGTTKKPTSNREYITALQAHPGAEFGADIEWSWYCNPNRSIYIDDGQGGSAEHPDKQGGCGKRYYQKDVASLKTEAGYPLRISCQCGAIVRGFSNATNFRK